MGGVPGGAGVGPLPRVVLRAKLASMCEIPSPLIECCLLGERYDMSGRRLLSGFYFKGAMNLIMAFLCCITYRLTTYAQPCSMFCG